MPCTRCQLAKGMVEHSPHFARELPVRGQLPVPDIVHELHLWPQSATQATQSCRAGVQQSWAMARCHLACMSAMKAELSADIARRGKVRTTSSGLAG